MNRSLQNILRAAALAAALPLVSAVNSVQAAGSGASDAVAQAMATTGSVPVKAAGPYVQIGSYRVWVSSHLGKPKSTLPDGTWVYPNFEGTDSDVHGALLVNFKQGRVSDMRLVTPAVLAAMMSPVKPASGSLVASRGK